MADPKSEKLLEAMNVEMQSTRKKNQVWDLVELPPQCKTIWSKWVFKKKTKIEDNLRTFEAINVAKGFS